VQTIAYICTGQEGGEREGRGGGGGKERVRPRRYTRVRADASVFARTRACSRGRERVRADASVSVRTYRRIRTNASVLPPGNFVTDATMRLSHGGPSSHCPTVRLSIRLSVLYHPCDNPVYNIMTRK
jgi:hypothetical protein